MTRRPSWKPTKNLAKPCAAWMSANLKKRICYRRGDGEHPSRAGNSSDEDWNSRGAGRLRGPRGDARGNGRRNGEGARTRRSRELRRVDPAGWRKHHATAIPARRRLVRRDQEI